MLRSLLSAVALLSLLFVSIAAPAAKAAAVACPDEPPSTLLSLYKKSDAVYIGKFEKTVEGDVISRDEYSTTVSRSDHFDISSTIKGESRKFFVREYEHYIYSGEENLESSDEEGPDDEYSRELKAGENVILFLKFKTEDEQNEKAERKLDVAHYRDGVKRLDESEVASYEAKINDLKGILSSGKANDAEIVSWLISCIEDPVTRWEGAYELYSSFQSVEWKERQAAEGDSEAEASEDADVHDDAAVNEEEPIGEEYEADEEFDNSVYASLLKDAQKSRLAQIAIESKPKKPEETKNLDFTDDGDRVLFDVVKRWGDAKLASAMLDRLRAAGGDNYEKLNWMSSIAEVLKDKELSAIEEKFGNATYQEDAEEFVEERKAEPGKVEPASAEQKTEPAESGSETADVKVEQAAADVVEDKKPKKTYKQYREELVADFINKADLRIAQERQKEEAK